VKVGLSFQVRSSIKTPNKRFQIRASPAPKEDFKYRLQIRLHMELILKLKVKIPITSFKMTVSDKQLDIMELQRYIS